MFVLEGRVCWSASDLTAAAECEYAVLRRLDVLRGRSERLDVPDDPMLTHVAWLGDEHERRELERLSVLHGDRLRRVERVGTGDPDALRALHEHTLEVLASDADVICQAGFFDGEFHGYADFLERTDQGWAVCDAKLARQVRTKALLQLAAYADQLAQAGLKVAPEATLLLGDGRRESFAAAELMPVFVERRDRLRTILSRHDAEGGVVDVDDPRFVACGRCDACAAALSARDDLLGVAGLRVDQRRRLRDADILTIADLAGASSAPAGMPARTFESLRAQARLQAAQADAGPGPDGRPQVRYELVGTDHLVTLPSPSPGDLFFDFEGDPLYVESDLTEWGLEYLWGSMEAPAPGARHGRFTPTWAHSRAEERQAFEQFVDDLVQRRRAHPGLHVYHYAPYETAALKRMAARFGSREAELDSLLRDGVFVDLYQVVRGSVRVSQPSYSIKKLEPLYMHADELRESDVTAGDQSIVEYHRFRALRDAGRHAEADRALRELADYNRYDCLSTLRLRDWLLGRAAEAGVVVGSTGARGAAGTDGVVGSESPEHDADADPDQPLLEALAARSGPPDRTRRTADEQTWAMLAAAVGYYRREALPFWWSHFDRLRAPLDEWAGTRDVFVVDDGVVEEPWATVGRQRTPRRTVRLRGAWGPGSTVADTSEAYLLYDEPAPEGTHRSTDGIRAWSSGLDRLTVGAEQDPALAQQGGATPPDTVRVVERAASAAAPADVLPAALTPAPPPRAESIDRAIRASASAAVEAGAIGAGPALDLLSRRPPRLSGSGALPATGDTVADLVSALRRLDHSYLPVQGPPGTGKTYTAARVIKRLVEEDGWQVGVVAQSHAAIDNVLAALCSAGLDPQLIGKAEQRPGPDRPGPDRPGPEERPWRTLPTTGGAVADFLAEHDGAVLGATAWTLTNETRVARACLDLVVVEEAGQFALAPTIGVAVATTRLLLIGDPRQLPQVSQGTHAEPVDSSALSWVMDGAATLPEHLGYLLSTSYRLHPRVCDGISELAYAGRLHAAEQTLARRLDGVEPGIVTVQVPHSGNRVASLEEAAAIVAQVERLLGREWVAGPEDDPRPLDTGDVLVVAPYNAQVNLLRRTLAAAGLGSVRVGTVDRFQGLEAAVVIVSMTASTAGDVPRGAAFLMDRHRINVAISRAQWRAVVVRSPNLTAYLPASPEAMLDLGAFLRLTQATVGRSTRR
ncbi:uncharacterized protein CLV56_3021 [Mumia flava]|uniref:AAA+ ATPase domain-containing protein n=1 Tax=Mumia flava TaxID=1348852 RepID=A0A0B2B4J6_9ACTN|nr:bifunctional RecB family nuclease/DEAD/DEAH box helicase [Mumia flava]PJJ53531.1 uncharacterized protein CLV56_3021 [Mumia flava]